MKDSLFIAKEFFNAKKLRTLEGAKINSSDKSESDKFLLKREMVILIFWLKFRWLLINYLSNVNVGATLVVAQKASS